MTHSAVKIESEERLEQVTFGMWLFIGSEIMFFTAFFAMYIIMRNAHPELTPPHTLEGLMNRETVRTDSRTAVGRNSKVADKERARQQRASRAALRGDAQRAHDVETKGPSLYETSISSANTQND